MHKYTTMESHLHQWSRFVDWRVDRFKSGKSKGFILLHRGQWERKNPGSAMYWTSLSSWFQFFTCDVSSLEKSNRHLFSYRLSCFHFCWLLYSAAKFHLEQAQLRKLPSVVKRVDFCTYMHCTIHPWHIALLRLHVHDVFVLYWSCVEIMLFSFSLSYHSSSSVQFRIFKLIQELRVILATFICHRLAFALRYWDAYICFPISSRSPWWQVLLFVHISVYQTRGGISNGSELGYLGPIIPKF